MNKLITIIKIIIFVSVFFLIKFFDDIFLVQKIFLYRFVEAVYFFMIGSVFCFLTDISKNGFNDKFMNAIKVGLGYTLVCFILSLTKTWQSTNYVLIGIINYAMFVLIGAIPFIRDKFLTFEDNQRTNTLNIAYIVYFFSAKLLLNILIGIIFVKLDKNIELANYISIIIFSIIVFLIKPIVFTFHLNGYLTHNDKDYPIFDFFRVGKTNFSDLQVSVNEAPKSTYFSIRTGKVWRINPGFSIKIGQKSVSTKSDLKDGETIKIHKEQFKINMNKGSFFKRFILLFIMIFMITGFAFGTEKKWALEESNQIIVENVDYSLFPLINAYINVNEDIKKKIEDNVIQKNDLFVVEGEKAVGIKSIETKNIPIDIIFILDITGSMYEKFLRFRSSLGRLAYNIKRMDRKVRIGFITFADLQANMQVYDLNDNIDEVIKYIKKIVPEAGGDFEENSFDAILKLEKMDFNKEAQKVIILFTDAPPHKRGDKKNKGKDFTLKSTEDIIDYVKASSNSFYVVSYKRFEEYQKIINNNPYKFYDIERYNDFTEIINSFENAVKNQIRISFYSRYGKDFYRKKGGKNTIKIYANSEVESAKENYNKMIIRKTSFFESLFGIF